MDIMLTDDERHLYNYGDYAVTIIDNFKIPISHEISLAAKIWFPEESVFNTFKDCKTLLFCKKKYNSLPKSPENFSVILEYLPYRKSDLTAQDDHGKYTWLASYGYVCMRVDIRGTGDSDGLLYDEYSQEEHEDCLELMNWLEKQAWCTGKVAMMGISWGGFNGLQMAYLQPPQLRTVISLCSTDDRFATDVHYDGGCLTGDGMISWATLILAYNALPPDPRDTLNWQDKWKKRLEAHKPWMANWLKHQTRDNYWKHGSVCQNYSRVKCPVLLVGGLKDPYRDAIFRMLENLKSVKAIIGPWGHSWPHTAVPGPNIDFLQICLQWFDLYLKGTNIVTENEPKLRAYLQDYIIPTEEPFQYVPGKWIKFDKWPSCRVTYQHWFLYNQNLILRHCNAKHLESTPKWDSVPFVEQLGIHYCVWVEMSESKSPYDHSKKKIPTLTYTSDQLEEDLILFGRPEFVCTVRLEDGNSGLLHVQLLNIDSNSRSSMISYGVRKIRKEEISDSDDINSDIKKYKSISVHLHAASLVIPKGHRLSLQVSPNFWPSVWCNDSKSPMNILTGIDEHHSPISFLTLPTLDEQDIQLFDRNEFNVEATSKGKALSVQECKPPSLSMQITYDPNEKVHKRSIESYHGKVFLNQQKVFIENCSKEKCTISDGVRTDCFSQSEMYCTLCFQNKNETDKQKASSCFQENTSEEKDNLVLQQSVLKDTERSQTTDLNDNTQEGFPNDSNGFTVKVAAKTCLSANDNFYHLQSSLSVSCNETEIQTKTWNEKINRL